MQYPFVFGHLPQGQASECSHFLCRFVSGLVGVATDSMPLIGNKTNARALDRLIIRSHRALAYSPILAVVGGRV
jgi:hypothetical protein